MKDVDIASPVRVTMPASVAADIGVFKKAVGTILDKLGCPACCSGHDIRFDIHRDLVFRDLESRGMPRAMAEVKPRPAANTVALAPETGAQIDNVFRAIDKIAEFTGCGACCSGHDLRLQFEQNFLLDEQLNVDAAAVRFG
ncbi:hypothetical protein MWU54_03630 [Marivita sp. S6314]|uniref:hypothetical protein n=1 Tax=Marivita sp. S6314 TaxID=2926406 RepID=UPI001FF2FFE0|nr:hypothetical protein [Marivita sp. S6314]MCK0149100.1 hypothetical protein [Marivita sp. S6314]